ncbi:hypothetical protein [Moritella viscosa]|uniref:ATP-binding protein n=1 Tax=Moritella viscosa TaxID=80854 RepID=A0ABY1HMN9_9GAMM|nr:hypothetical protein [Moritella viscosa]SGZ02264.1 Putative uncharacterized protein [Moritella viscosa]SGZ15178.1 Putative uncharacterized protein [Moritella viscosa]SHO28132.1 Putative uncharacterized protein [Moritella viscosa]
MQIDVKGKVKNLTLSPNDRLVPVFEAIVNSIQATRKDNKADLTVTAFRQATQEVLHDEDRRFQQIESFEIVDYGDGFNQKNYQSFKTAESTHKSNLGCKGVGRFTWLKAFETVEVESIYLEGESMKKLTFGFSVDDVDFESEKFTDAVQSEKVRTKVSLKEIQDPYRSKLPKDLDSIASEIIEHCLIYFLEDKIKSFKLLGDCGESIDLLVLFKTSYSNEIKQEDFSIGSNTFKAHFFKNIKINKQKNHKVFLCADSRSVRGYTLKEYEENIPPIFEDIGGIKFNYSIYVTSSYLDQYVNQERTGFRIAEKVDLCDEDEDSPAINTIIIELMVYGRTVFEPFLEPMYAKHREMIERYVNHAGYEYRHIIKNRPLWLNKIPFDLSDEKLDLELHKLNRNYEIELKQEAQRLKDELKHSKIKDYPAYKKSLQKYTEDLNEVGKSNLAKYIVHRKAVIDALEFSLEFQDNDKYALEDTVHDIIMAIRSTSDDVQEHNLWLIDERMAYHKHLASDKSFKSVTDIDSKERPDLLVFNNPVVYGDDKRETSTAIIVEFKRPMRDNYKDSDNPIDQVTGYVLKLRKPDQIKDDRGREIHLDKRIPIYCYVICDLTSSIREILEIRNYKPLLDNQGYIFYNDNLNTVIEVISFDKLLRDAKKRNSILFKKLHLE